MADPLETLRARLYKPGADTTFTPPPLHPHAEATSAPTAWTQPEPITRPTYVIPGHAKMPWTSKFLIGAGIFFVIAAAVAAFLFLRGSNSISAERVTVTVQGGAPSIASGDTVALVITVKNDNPATITDTNLVVDLPDGTRDANDISKPLDTYSDTLGDIAPGAEVSRTVNVILFGAQNQALTIPASVQYRAPGSNAQFESKGQYSVTVTTSPLAIQVSGLSETASGQPFTLAVTVRSNASTDLSNVALEATYPFGFRATQTNPPPASGSTFALGTLRPGEQKTITITGTLTGSDSDERVFRFIAGTSANGGVTLPYASSDTAIRIAKPFLATTITLNRDSTDGSLVPPGQSVNGTILWQNNLTVPVSDAQIVIKFSGNGFDASQVFTQTGFYRSSDATILYSKDTNHELAQLLPGDTGSGAFSFTPKSAAALKGIPNPTVTLTVSIAGNRVSQNHVPEAISSTVTRTVKIGTNVDFSSRLVRTIGPFKNTGPLPPVANAETTYTVMLTARNSVNSVGGALATMTLPSYVRFTGAVNPANSVTYDPRTRRVTWHINDLAPSATANAAFQIALLPSASQTGTSPVLVSDQTFTGTDRFTKEALSLTAEKLTTQMPADPAYRSDYGLVK